MRQVLEGRDGPATRVMLANAAAALLAAEKAASLRDAVSLARQAISSGRAGAVLEKLRDGGRLATCSTAP